MVLVWPHRATKAASPIGLKDVMDQCLTRNLRCHSLVGRGIGELSFRGKQATISAGSIGHYSR